MPQITLTSVARTAGKVYVRFGKTELEFASNADASAWAATSEEDMDALRRMLARVAIQRNLIPGGAGGSINLKFNAGDRHVHPRAQRDRVTPLPDHQRALVRHAPR
jgi:hypothetical protein